MYECGSSHLPVGTSGYVCTIPSECHPSLAGRTSSGVRGGACCSGLRVHCRLVAPLLCTGARLGTELGLLCVRAVAIWQPCMCTSGAQARRGAEDARSMDTYQGDIWIYGYRGCGWMRAADPCGRLRIADGGSKYGRRLGWSWMCTGLTDMSWCADPARRPHWVMLYPYMPTGRVQPGRQPETSRPAAPCRPRHVFGGSDGRLCMASETP